MSTLRLKANHVSKREIEENESENCGVKNVKAKVHLRPVSCRGKTSDHFLRARLPYLSIPIVIPVSLFNRPMVKMGEINWVLLEESQGNLVSKGPRINVNYVNPGYFSPAATALKPQQIPMFLHISARVWGRRWSPHTSEQKGSMLKPQ